MFRLTALFVACISLMGDNALGLNLRASDNARDLNSLFEEEVVSDEFFFDIELRSSKCDIPVPPNMDAVMLAGLRSSFMDLDVSFNYVIVGGNRPNEEVDDGVRRNLDGRYAYGSACRRCGRDDNDRMLVEEQIEPLDAENIKARMERALWISVFETMLKDSSCLKEDAEKFVKVKLSKKLK